jgi:hypothetical protein
VTSFPPSSAPPSTIARDLVIAHAETPAMSHCSYSRSGRPDPRLAIGLRAGSSAVAVIVFVGPFVFVLGPLSTLAFATGYVLVGVALWTGSTTSWSRHV